MSRDVITVDSTMRIPLLYQVSIVGTAPNVPLVFKDPKLWTTKEKRIKKIDCLARHMCGSEYDEQDRKAAILYEYETYKAVEGEKLLDTYLRYLQVTNDLKKFVYKKDNSLITEKEKVSKGGEKVVVHSDSEESDDEDISDLKKITLLLAKAFNRKKYYGKPTNNNLRTSSTSTSANKKPKYVKQEDKKEDGKKQDMSKVKC
nr:hypothetical protein [Tanacetum cinerariifolium]